MKKTPPQKSYDADVASESWQRFERAVDAAVRSGPKHNPAKKLDGKEAEPKG